jgi:hypothetical protein
MPQPDHSKQAARRMMRRIIRWFAIVAESITDEEMDLAAQGMLDGWRRA